MLLDCNLCQHVFNNPFIVNLSVFDKQHSIAKKKFFLSSSFPLTNLLSIEIQKVSFFFNQKYVLWDHRLMEIFHKSPDFQIALKLQPSEMPSGKKMANNFKQIKNELLTA